MSYDPGDIWEPTLEVRDSAGALTNATVALAIIAPDGTSSAQTPTNVSTGLYRGSVVLTTLGQWTARWTVSGAVTGVEEQFAYVRRLGSNVIGIAEVKTALNKTLRVDDAEIERMLDAAIAEYEQYVGPVSGSVTEKHDGGRARIVLRNPAVSEITAVSYADGTTVDIADLDLDTATGILGWGYNTAGVFSSWGVRNVTVTYTVGALPANHREAIIADVAGYFEATQRGPAPMMDEGYAAGWSGSPLVLFPRIRALAAPSIA